MPLDSKNYNCEIKRLSFAIIKALENDNYSETLSCFEEYFRDLKVYLEDREDNKVTNEDISNSVGHDNTLDSVIEFASTYTNMVVKTNSNKESAYSLIFSLANCFFNRAYYKTAHSLFEIVKQVASEEQNAECALSLSLLFEEVGNIIEATSILEKALFRGGRLSDIKKKYNSRLNTLRARIVLDNLLSEDDTKKKTPLDYMNELEKCSSRVETAIVQNEDNYEAYYVQGLIYEKQALYSNTTEADNLRDKAIASIKLSIDACSSNTDSEKLFRGNSYTELGKICDSKKDYVAALENFETAKKIFEKDGLNYPVYASIVDDLILQTEAKIKDFNHDQGFSDEIHKIMTSSAMTDLEKRYYENKAIRKNFIKERHRMNGLIEPELYTLQRWNSFTPILSTDKSPSKGGGYFVFTGSVGIVFDPGFDFIQNFRNAGMNFNDIDYIFITHAHNDHTADLESLLSLLHDYNEAIKGHRFSEKENSIFKKMMKKYPKEKEEIIDKKVEEAFRNSPRRKRLHIYVSPGTNQKCGFLKLGNKEYELSILNTSQVNYDDNMQTCLYGGIKIKYVPGNSSKYITIYPIPAKHDDLMTDRDCFGYVVSFMPEKITLWYTGDTGFSEEMGRHFSAIKRLLAPHLELSTEEMNDYRGMVLLAHIGGFKPDEQYYYRTNAFKAFYKNHLGRLGICKMIECLNPSVCLISEFGEEFTNCRNDLINIFQKQYPKTVIIPTDVDCRLRLISGLGSEADIRMQVEKKDFVHIKEVKFDEIPDEITNELEIKYHK